jgi:phosphoserine phosphatase
LTGRASILLKKNTLVLACNYLCQVGWKQGFIDSQFYGNFRTMDVDISFQEDNMFRRNRRLVCFDGLYADSNQVIDELLT